MTYRLRTLALLALAIGGITAAPAAAVPPPVPQAPDLAATSDSGVSAVDNITNDPTPDFTVDAGAAQVGMTVVLYRRDVDLQGSEVFVAVGSSTVASNGVANVSATTTLDGTQLFFASTRNGSNEESGRSAGLQVTVDTTPPVITGAPFLVDFVGTNTTFTSTPYPRFAVEVTSGDTACMWEGTVQLGCAESENSFALVTTGISLGDGAHTVYATAFDVAGNAPAQKSPDHTISVDSTPPDASAPDLLAEDDDGASATDNSTKNPRPRFTVTTDPGARVLLYEKGVALGSATADPTGVAVVRVRDTNWFEPGVHCVYVIAIDLFGNTGTEGPALCVTVVEGATPFTTNLGVSMDAGGLSVSVSSSVAARVLLRVVRAGKTVKVVSRALKARTPRTIRVRVHGKGKLRVVANVRSNDGRRTVLRRLVAR
jgi:hypothetical protein